MRRVLCLLSVGIACLGCSCIVEKPIADPSTHRSISAKLFALDCRAWQTGPGEVEAEVGVVDFADGSGSLSFRWRIDGVDTLAKEEPRPRASGHFLKYSLVRTLSHRFERSGQHVVDVVVANGKERTAQCGMTLVSS
jgi:hypothetical protein